MVAVKLSGDYGDDDRVNRGHPLARNAARLFETLGDFRK